MACHKNFKQIITFLLIKKANQLLLNHSFFNNRQEYCLCYQKKHQLKCILIINAQKIQIVCFVMRVKTYQANLSYNCLYPILQFNNFNMKIRFTHIKIKYLTFVKQMPNLFYYFILSNLDYLSNYKIVKVKCLLNILICLIKALL